eukprot:3732689-Rhodomonas_salina.1
MVQIVWKKEKESVRFDDGGPVGCDGRCRMREPEAKRFSLSAWQHRRRTHARDTHSLDTADHNSSTAVTPLRKTHAIPPWQP